MTCNREQMTLKNAVGLRESSQGSRLGRGGGVVAAQWHGSLGCSHHHGLVAGKADGPRLGAGDGSQPGAAVSSQDCLTNHPNYWLQTTQMSLSQSCRSEVWHGCHWHQIKAFTRPGSSGTQRRESFSSPFSASRTSSLWVTWSST